jgi:hypothetical protein
LEEMEQAPEEEARLEAEASDKEVEENVKPSATPGFDGECPCSYDCGYPPPPAPGGAEMASLLFYKSPV